MNGNKPTLRRQKTVPIDKDEVDFRVVRFSCLDTSALTMVGKHCKETSWTVSVGDKKVEIILHVDKVPGSHYEVAVECDGQVIFPDKFTKRSSMMGSVGRAPLKQDITWTYPFCGTVKGIGKPQFFEVRPMHSSQDRWWPATLKDQLDESTFRALLYMDDDAGGVKEVFYPLVTIDNVRVMGTKKPLVIPKRSLVLRVPAVDPLHGTLAVDGELITHFFGRPTPPPARSPLRGQASRVTLSVRKDRSLVSADVGAARFQHFLTGDVRAIKEEAKKSEHTWWLQVGPFAEHKVEIRKHDTDKKVFVLLIDDEILVESAAEDIESREDWWECPLRLAGEKYLDWDVFETDVDGHPLDSKGIVSQKTKYAHELIVSFAVSSSVNLGQARLLVDNNDFCDLPQFRKPALDEPLQCSPEALRGTYNLLTPYKINETSQDPFEMLRKVFNGFFCTSPVGGTPATGGGLLGCCTRPQAEVGNLNNPIAAPRFASPPPTARPGAVTGTLRPRPMGAR